MVKVAESILRVFYNSKNNNDDNDNTHWITALEFLFYPPQSLSPHRAYFSRVRHHDGSAVGLASPGTHVTATDRWDCGNAADVCCTWGLLWLPWG